MNPAEQRPETQLVKKVAELERAIQDLKTAQLLGGDNLNLDEAGVLIHAIVPPATIANYRVTFYVNIKRLFASEVGISRFYVTDNDPNHQWPDGNALTGTQKNMKAWAVYDPASSDEVGTGAKSYIVTTQNTDSTTPVDQYLHVRLIFPKVGISA